jgi:hypothetical protein
MMEDDMDRKDVLKALRTEIRSNPRGVSRSRFLALAFLRGRPYRSVELTTNEDRSAKAQGRERADLEWGTLSHEVARIVKPGARAWDVDKDVAAEAALWLAVPATEAMLEAARVGRERYLDAKRARANARQAAE